MMKNPKKTLKLRVFSGFHDPNLDSRFLANFLSAWETTQLQDIITLEISLYAIGDWLQPSVTHDTKVNHDHPERHHGVEGTIFLGFSAGCMRAALASQLYQATKKPVLGLIAVDGWGLPLIHTQIPIYRLSHDLFTHNSSMVLGGKGVFFADPPVPHLSIWEYPDCVSGWYCRNEKTAMEMKASQALILTIQALASPFFGQSEQE